MKIPDDPHTWFQEHLDAFIAGGLTPEERAAMNAHSEECGACATTLSQAIQSDEAIRKLFQTVTPSAHFEENLIMNLRTLTAPKPLIHPSVFRAATSVAAVIVLGGLGLIGQRAMKDGKFPELSLQKFSIPQFSWFSKQAYLPENPGQNQLAVVDATTRPTSDPSTSATRLSKALHSTQDLHDSFANRSKNVDDFSEANLGEVARDGRLKVTNGRGESTSAKVESLGLQLPELLAENAETKMRGGREFREKEVKANKWYKEAGKVMYSKDVIRAQGLERRDGEKPASGDSVDFGTTALGRTRNLGTAIDQSGDGSNRGLNRHGEVVAGNGIVRYEQIDELSRSKDDAKKLPEVSLMLKTEPSGAAGLGYAYQNGSTAPTAPQAYYFKPTDAQSSEPGLKFQAGLAGPYLTPSQLTSDAPPKPALIVALGNDSEVKQEIKGVKELEDVTRQKAAEGDVKVLEKDEVKPQAVNTGVASPPPVKTQENLQAQQGQRKIIRNGQLEFEVDSFDSSFMQIGKIVGEDGGYVSSTDSEKLSNGKVKGTVTVRVPPDRLDVLVLKLRGLGDLKSQKIAAQDITKQYTDLESGLRAARTMEERLLEIIKSGKGEVKDLVEAEKQLGVYRERIEQVEGELRYYGNLVSLSTLNITLFERDIKTPTAAFETEQVQAGIEVEDVEKARTSALKAIDDAKGRVIESNLKKLDAGQLTATIVAELSPDAAGALTDRLKQLGRVARLEAERKQTTTGGTGAPVGLKMERKATRFNISLYNLANIAPRENVNLTMAVEDVETAYKTILGVMNAEDAASMGRIVSSTLNSQKKDQTTGAISLEVKSDKSNAVETAIRGTGEVLNLSTTENPDANNVTRSKRGYSISLISVAQVAPRETQTLQVAAKNVPAAYAKLLTTLQDPKQPSRILSSQLNEQDRQNVTGQIDVEVPRTAIGAVEAILVGPESDVYSRTVSRANDAQNTLDTKVRLSVTLIAADRLQPRETTTIALEVNDVEATLSNVVNTSGARIVERQLSKQQNGRIVAHAVIDVPLTSAPATLDILRNLGTVRVVDSSKNQQVPEGPLARARFDVALGNVAPIMSAEDGAGARFRQGLQTSLNGLTFSLMLIVIGVCLVGPFALLIWAAWKFFRRGKVKAATV